MASFGGLSCLLRAGLVSLSETVAHPALGEGGQELVQQEKGRRWKRSGWFWTGFGEEQREEVRPVQGFARWEGVLSGCGEHSEQRLGGMKTSHARGFVLEQTVPGIWIEGLGGENQIAEALHARLRSVDLLPRASDSCQRPFSWEVMSSGLIWSKALAAVVLEERRLAWGQVGGRALR